MKRNLIETLMGAIVLAAAAFFVFSTYKSSGVSDDYGYKLTAVFDKIDGISTGSDVRIGGIKVGAVNGQQLDKDSYRARVTLGINGDVRIPTDSTAEIVSDGLLGGKYVSIVPGAEMEMLNDGGEIEYTQSSVNLEQLIGKMAFGGTDAKEEKEAQPVETAKPIEQKLTPSLLEDKPVPAKETPKKEEAKPEVSEPAPAAETPKAEDKPTPMVIRVEKKTDENNKPVVTRKSAPEETTETPATN